MNPTETHLFKQAGRWLLMSSCTINLTMGSVCAHAVPPASSRPLVDADPLTPTSHVPSPALGITSGRGCNLDDRQTSLAKCDQDIEQAQRQLQIWAGAKNDRTRSLGEDTYNKLRLIYERRIANDYLVIDKLGGKPKRHSESFSPYLFQSPFDTQANSNVNYAGVSVDFANYTGSATEIGIFSASGSFTVPTLVVPNTTVSGSSPNGTCDGVNTLNYAQSWWIGIVAGNIYQAGVKGVLQCKPGQTKPVVTYLGWVENYPTDPVEVDLAQFNNVIQAGDVITVSIKSNWRTAMFGPGVMTYDLSDTTPHGGVTVTTGTLQRKNSDGSAPASTSAAAIAEREPDGGGGIYFATPSTPNVTGMFSNLVYGLAYQQLNGNQTTLVSVSPLAMDKSQGSGSRCQTSYMYCTEAILQTAAADLCDAETGTGPTTESAGYIYSFIAPPQPGGC